MSISVLLPLPLNDPFDYLSEQPLAPGTLVKVPFGPRQIIGVVWTEKSSSPPKALKPILHVIEDFTLPDISLKFIDWMSTYTMTPRGQILKMTLPIPEVFEPKKEKKGREKSAVVVKPNPSQKSSLSPDQRVAADDIRACLATETFQTFLLEGVTGSGKTEVYFEAIDAILQKGGQALVMLPEISLSSQWLQRFERRFGFQPALWHSDLSKSQRKATFQAIVAGAAPVIVGARSSLFLPFPSLKLIIVDEEHDGSYKQEEGAIYNARDMAVMRSRLGGATCVLASATPSLETELNVQSGKYSALRLSNRYGGAEMPTVTLLDLRKDGEPKRGAGGGEGPTSIAPLLRQALEETLARGEQAMLFLNRRGYAPMILCRGCGERIMCPQCTVSLVLHKFHQKLLCHHCGHSAAIPTTCAVCSGHETYGPVGVGVERLYEEVQALLPQARYALMTSDHLATTKKREDHFQKIHNHEVDILIGTQIMAKGHHFPLLTLVGIVDGDSALSGSDLRAAEKAFQLFHQVAGRSGREARKGRVLLQTYMPEHPVMQALAQQDRGAFVALETEQRLLYGFPPYGRLAALILSGKKEEDVISAARLLARTFPLTERAELLGPTPAPLSFLRGNYRWRLLLKTTKDFAPQSLLKFWLAQTPLPSSVRVQIDIDPYSFL